MTDRRCLCADNQFMGVGAYGRYPFLGLQFSLVERPMDSMDHNAISANYINKRKIQGGQYWCDKIYGCIFIARSCLMWFQETSFP
jgi:hypothetical protein